MQDPLMGLQTRYYTVLFVQTEEDRAGRIFYVTRDIVQAYSMQYESKPAQRPELSGTFFAKELLSYIPPEQYPNGIESVLRPIPAPPRQRIFSPNTMQYEQCKPDGTLYQAHEDKPPYMKCTEWTEEHAIPALRQHQVIRTSITTVSPSST